MSHHKKEGKLLRGYYGPQGFWKGLPAVTRLTQEAGVSGDDANLLLTWQAILLACPKAYSKTKFYVESQNAVHQANPVFPLRDNEDKTQAMILGNSTHQYDLSFVLSHFEF